MKNLKSKSQGLTLIELVIATGILAMVLVMAIGSYTSFSQMVRQTQQQRGASETIQLIYNAIGSQVWNAQEITSLSSTQARLKLRDGRDITLRFSNNKITLNGKKLLPDNIKVYRYGSKFFEGSTSGTPDQQPYLRTSFILKVYDRHNRLIKEYADPVSFIHTLRQ
jgi:competence protein ComGC